LNKKAPVFDWNDLRHFLAVTRTGSTNAAGKVLRVNQSTVQRRLAALEEAIGRKLFERHSGGYRLTALGEDIRAQAEAVETAVAALERRLAATDTALTGTIRVTCAEGIASFLITPLLEAFRLRYPGLRVDLLIADRYFDLAKGEADVAVRAGAPADETLVGRKIADNTWAVYASHAYVKQHGRPERVADLDRHAVIAFDDQIAGLHAARWLSAVAPNAAVAARSNTVSGLVWMAKSGIDLAVLPVHLGDPQAELVRVLDPVRELDAPLYLLVHPDLRQVPRVRAFLDFVVAEIDRFRPAMLGRREAQTRASGGEGE
jgi:DNA-binding transcriptional LysR family regulator